MHHEPMQIAGPVHPPCCEAATSTACQLCRLEDLPRADLALSAASNQNHQSADSVFVSRNNRLPVPAMQAAGGRATVAVELHPPLLYLQTLTLLI